jgi:hypothetical protein
MALNVSLAVAVLEAGAGDDKSSADVRGWAAATLITNAAATPTDVMTAPVTNTEPLLMVLVCQK